MEFSKTIEKDQLFDYIPHRGKMFLIDRITEHDVDNWKISSETKIDENFTFFEKEKNGVPNYALFEVAAQTISALTGLYVKKNNLPPTMGMILSVSGLHFDMDFVKSGSVVGIYAERDAEMGDIFTFRTEFFVNSQKIGKGKLTVMVTNFQ